MVRLKYSFLAKLAAILVISFFALPSFLRLLNDLPDDATNLNEPNEKKRSERLIIDSNNNIRENLAAVLDKSKLGNYEPVLEPRYGPGENGEGVTLQNSEKAAGDESVAIYGFNMVASDKISLDRRIKDTRRDECKYWNYPEISKLPTASVVLVFVNEGWSTLMRTVHSVINTSPPELLKEVILVDDYSNKDHLKDKLERYIARFNGLVKLYRTSKREGLIEARMVGARNAQGDVIVILDAHCECVTNWLPPLLTRIAVNRRTVAVPIVDGIEWNNLQHTDIYGGALNRGIFEWGFLYKETEVPTKEKQRHTYGTEPYWSPTHAGGLLAIDKKWFFELGGYDPGIKIWGGEQYELSFKVWQCGGTVEWVPCSHVAHIYRGPRRESVHPPGGHYHQTAINHMRLAEVWMDEYKEYYYIRSPEIQKLPIGDTSEQVAIRNKLQCKPFKWFMEEIAYDLTVKFPLPPRNKVWGECSNNQNRVCLDVRSASFGQPIGVSGCHHGFGNQLFRLNVEGELSSGESCFISDRDRVIKKFCLDSRSVWNPIGEWDYDKDNLTIKSNKEKKCLWTDGSKLTLMECNDNDPNQKWSWKELYF